MAEKTTPNTFSQGMITDLDPAYQSKESYFTGLNVRVITNGDKSFSIENLKGPTIVDDPQNTGVPADYVTHGAVIVDDYLITIKKQLADNDNWLIKKHTINSSTLDIDSGTTLWSGSGLFEDDAGKIEIESIVETETIHRIYCTDGKTALKGINLKDENLSTKTVDELTAFRPNLMKPAQIIDLNQTGGGLYYGSYAYVYRLGSQGQGSYTDWSSVSSTVNIVKNSISDNTSLVVQGDTSANMSSSSVKVRVPNISQDFQNIQVAAIHYTSQNVPTINIIEESSISGENHTFIHSGFEEHIPVEGGIAAAIISNEKWNSCKSLAQKDNKLYASNLKSTVFNIDDTISGFGKMKSYKAVKDSNNDYNLSTHSSDENPHRHNNGSQYFNWNEDLETDKNIYKFINKNFATGASPDQNPIYVLGAETVGFSSGSDGFRMTFRQESYIIDETFNKRPDGTSATTTGSGASSVYADISIDEVYTVDPSNNDVNYGGGKPGPYNPMWDNSFRSFKRGECYRFGIVFYDKQGTPGFVYHIGDIKMPDALDPNGKILNPDNVNQAIDKPYHSQNSCWSPFSDGDNSDEVVAHALIPTLEVRLPQSVLSVISGYRVVRAELTDADKTIITQGIYDHTERHHPDYGSDLIKGKVCLPGVGLHYAHNRAPNYDQGTAYPYRIPQKIGILHTPDVTMRNMDYNLGPGYMFRPVLLLEANKTHSNLTLTDKTIHKYFGYDADSNMDGGGEGGTGFHVTKWKPWNLLINSSSSQNTKSNIKTPGDGWYYFFRWARDLFLSKTVVNQEVVASSIHQSDNYHFINQSAVYKDGQFSHSNDSADSGDFFIDMYSQESRSDQSGETPTCIMLAMGPNGNSIFLPGQVKIVSGSSNTSISNYASNNHRTNQVSQNSLLYHYEGFKWLGEIIRDTSDGFEQYGGHSDSAIQNTRFYPCRDFVETSTVYSTYRRDINRGDVYCDWYTMKNSTRTLNTNSGYQYGTIFPLESYVNISLRSGSYLGTEDQVKVNVLDDFLYNTAYSQEDNLISYTAKPTDWSDNDTFKAKVAVSKTKILGELYDGWTQFPTNDFIDLNLSNGKITDLVNYKNQLYAVQDSGVSLLSVNSRALIQGEGAAADIQIVTGTGTAIERYDYLTNQFGSQHFNTSKVTPTGFYFVDVDKKEVIKCDGQSIIPLALSNNYKDYITTALSGVIPVSTTSTTGLIGHNVYGIHTGYDPEFRELHYTVTDSSYSSHNFTISDLNGSLISTLALIPQTLTTPSFPNIYFNNRNNFYAVTNNGSGIEKTLLMNSGLYQKFEVGFVINDNPAVKKIFDQAEVIVDQNSEFSQHLLEDSIGNSGIAIEERVRDESHLVPLRSNNVTGRFRGNWLKYTLKYTSSASKKFNIFAVVSKVRQSR